MRAFPDRCTTGHVADNAVALIDECIALMRRAGAPAIQPEAGHAGITFPFVRDEGSLADEEGLVKANVAAEAGRRQD